MIVGRLPRVGVRVEGVRVVGKGGDPQAIAVEKLQDGARVEVVDVDVGDACVAPVFAAARWPARNLERLEAVLLGPLRDLLERLVRERRGQQAEFHRAAALTGRSTSTHRCSRELRATASQTRLSSWPSAKVG